MSSPVVVIGAGANELVAAHCLARAGHRVLVLERGGAGDTQSADDGWVAPRIARELRLEQHGLEIHRPDPWAAVPLAGGGRLELWQDMARSVEAIRHLNPEDAAKWPAFCERMARLARLLESVYLAPPPDPLSRGAGDLMQLVRLGLRAKRLGRQGIEDLLRILPMPVADLLDDWFESDALKGVLGAAGVMHLHQGPRSGGTAFNLLHGHVGNAPGVFRPARSNLAQLLAGLAGVEIRRDAEIARIDVRAGRAAGVVLAGGHEIAASLVISGADPRRSFELVNSGWLDPEFLRAVRHIRCRGVAARLTFELSRAPGFSTLVVAPSLDYLERAYDDAKYGRVSQQPYLEAGATEPKPGRHRVAVHMQYAPYALADGDWDEMRRDSLGDSVARVISGHVPDFGAAVTARGILSPRDLEALEGWPEGQARHAELALDQILWMRPLPELARYRTPIAGLYLCGPAMHPGGGIAGAAGYHCSREVLRDFGRKSPG